MPPSDQVHDENVIGTRDTIPDGPVIFACLGVAPDPPPAVDIERRALASQESDALERLFRFQDDLLTEPSQSHGLGELRYADRVVEEVAGKLEIGVIGTVSADDIIGREVNVVVLDKEGPGALGVSAAEVHLPILYQNGYPVEYAQIL